MKRRRVQRSLTIAPHVVAVIAETARRILEGLRAPDMPLDAYLQHDIGDHVGDGTMWHVRIVSARETTRVGVSHDGEAARGGRQGRKRYPSARSWAAIREAIAKACEAAATVDVDCGKDGASGMWLDLAVEPPENLVEANERYRARPSNAKFGDADALAEDPYRDGYYSWNRWWNAVYARKYGRPLGEASRSRVGRKKRTTKSKKSAALALNDPSLRMPRAGEYWRVTDPGGTERSLLGLIARSDGIYVNDPVLLVTDVYYVENAPHSVRILSHPQAPRGEITTTIAWFIENFDFAEDGAEVRRRELAAIEDQMRGISEDMERGPSVETLQALSDDILDLVPRNDVERDEDDEEDEDQAQVALPIPRSGPQLPALRTALPTAFAQSTALLEAATKAHDLTRRQAAWLTERAQAVSRRAEWIASFHTERVKVQISALGPQRRHIDELQKGLVSLDVYAGKDVEVEQLVEGESAAPSERLHLLQRRLYMDEEYLVNLSTGGADWSDFASFADLISENTAFLERVLPFPRCVVAMRYRRNDKRYYQVEQVASVFEAWGLEKANDEANEPNRETFFLIRDGENIYRVFSDVATNSSSRLFPKTEEFDSIFRADHGWGKEEEPKRIEFGDLAFLKASYAQKELALHYRRVLILLWGLQAREGIFGPFYDPDEYSNIGFLDRRLQADRMVFVADDDAVLTEGRPSFRVWLDARNAHAAPGSRIVASWEGLIDHRSAPTIERQDYRTGNTRRLGNPVTTVSSSIIHIREGQLCADTMATMRNGKRRTAHVRLTGVRRGLFGTTSALVLDDAKVEDIDYYLRSREARQEYLHYWQIFATARRELLRDEERMAPLIKRLRRPLADDGLEEDALDQAMSTAIRLWRLKNRGALPTSSTKPFDEIRALAVSIARPSLTAAAARAIAEREGRAILRLTIDGAGTLEIEGTANADEIPAFGLPHPWIVRRRLRLSEGAWETTGASAFILWEAFDPSRYEIHRFPKATTMPDDPFAGIAGRDEAQRITRTSLVNLADEMRVAGARSRVLLREDLPTFDFEEAAFRTTSATTKGLCHVAFETPLAILERVDQEPVLRVLWARSDVFGVLWRANPSTRPQIQKYWERHAAYPEHHITSTAKDRPTLLLHSLAYTSDSNGFTRGHFGSGNGIRLKKKVKKGLRYVDADATFKEFAAGDATLAEGYPGHDGYRVVTWLDVHARRLAERIIKGQKKGDDDD